MASTTITTTRASAHLKRNISHLYFQNRTPLPSRVDWCELEFHIFLAVTVNNLHRRAKAVINYYVLSFFGFRLSNIVTTNNTNADTIKFVLLLNQSIIHSLNIWPSQCASFSLKFQILKLLQSDCQCIQVFVQACSEPARSLLEACSGCSEPLWETVPASNQPSKNPLGKPS